MLNGHFPFSSSELAYGAFHCAPREGGGLSLLYISIAYYMHKGGGEGVQIACQNAYVINGRPLY